jgi:hypothetical protein
MVDAGCAVKVGVGVVVVVNAAVLTEAVVGHPVLVLIRVIFTAFEAPAFVSVGVENVPVPGLPEVKLIEVEVEATVLVPLTL